MRIWRHNTTSPLAAARLVAALAAFASCAAADQQPLTTPAAAAPRAAPPERSPGPPADAPPDDLADAPAGPAAADAASAQLVGEARALLERGEHAAAIDLLESARQQWPRDEAVWLGLIDVELDRGRYAAALRRAAEAQDWLGGHPAVHLRCAQAHLALGADLGVTRVESHRDGRPGQFAHGCLLVERRGTAQRFLCCGPDSALFQVRKALDGGLDEPAAHLLHARIWQRLGRPEVALAILRNRRAALLGCDEPGVLETFAELSLATGALDEYLEYTRRLAARRGAEGQAILRLAYWQVARRYNSAGDPALHLAFLERAAATGPPPPDLMLELADALWSAGRTGQSAAWYRRVLERFPDHPERARLLARLAP